MVPHDLHDSSVVAIYKSRMCRCTAHADDRRRSATPRLQQAYVAAERSSVACSAWASRWRTASARTIRQASAVPSTTVRRLPTRLRLPRDLQPLPRLRARLLRRTVRMAARERRVRDTIPAPAPMPGRVGIRSLRLGGGRAAYNPRTGASADIPALERLRSFRSSVVSKTNTAAATTPFVDAYGGTGACRPPRAARRPACPTQNRRMRRKRRNGDADATHDGNVYKNTGSGSAAGQQRRLEATLTSRLETSNDEAAGVPAANLEYRFLRRAVMVAATRGSSGGYRGGYRRGGGGGGGRRQ